MTVTIRQLLDNYSTAILRGNRAYEESLISEDEAFAEAHAIRDQLIDIIGDWIDVDELHDLSSPYS